jgi:hypothetical protein
MEHLIYCDLDEIRDYLNLLEDHKEDDLEEDDESYL